MKITLVLKDSIFDCQIRITDSRGCRNYYLSALHSEEDVPPSILVEVYDSEFVLTLIPIMINTLGVFNEWEVNNWKDKLAKKASKALVGVIDKTFLRAACTYRIENVLDDDRLDIVLQNYVFSTWDRWNLLELIPICYAFYEVTCFNNSFKMTHAYETNRKEVLKFAKAFSLAQVFGNGLLSFFTYPIQMSRAKRLTKNRKILKTLTKYNQQSDAERQQFLKKQEKFFDQY